MLLWQQWNTHNFNLSISLNYLDKENSHANIKCVKLKTLQSEQTSNSNLKDGDCQSSSSLSWNLKDGCQSSTSSVPISIQDVLFSKYIRTSITQTLISQLPWWLKIIHLSIQIFLWTKLLHDSGLKIRVKLNNIFCPVLKKNFSY